MESVSRATSQRKHTPFWWRLAQEFALTDPERPQDKDDCDIWTERHETTERERMRQPAREDAR